MSVKLLLDKAFNQDGKEVRGGEIMYDCPKCNHHKPKLSVNVESQNWKCWICGHTHDTRGKSIFTLFKFLKAPKKLFEELKKLKLDRKEFKIENIEEKIQLPEEFRSLTKKSIHPGYRQALFYLKRRGITISEIIKYNIGYCVSGDYKDRIILPSYDASGMLNYFVARTWIKDHTLKYKNPPVSKNVVGLELFVNWNLPVYLCEGIFDAIAIKRNAIPLFGKTLNDSLRLALIANSVKDVYIVLDQDALYNVMRNAEELQSWGINVHAVELTGKDPSQLGYVEIQNLISQTKQFEFNDLLKLKLSL